jgi:hypothetical protein
MQSLPCLGLLYALCMILMRLYKEFGGICVVAAYKGAINGKKVKK